MTVPSRLRRPAAGLLAGLAGLMLSSLAPAGAPVVRSVAPAGPPRTLELEELWRIGGEGSDLLVGTVTETATDGDGNLYLLDSQLAHVLVISPAGELLRTISREGEGPGEVRQPRDVVCLPDGTIGIMTMFPARIVRLTPQGEPRESLTVTTDREGPASFVAGIGCRSGGGNLVLAASRLFQTETGQDRRMYLCRLGEDGREGVRYCESTMSLDFGRLHFVERELSPAFHTAWAVGPGGRVFAAVAWDRYRIAVWDPDGTPVRTIEREFRNRERTADELRRVNALFDASARNNRSGETREVEPSPPAISGLHVDADGRLWVLHSRADENLPPGVMQAYDLFDADGRYLREVRVRCEGDPDRDGLELLPDGRVLLIRGLVLASMMQSDLGSIPLGEDEEIGPMEFVCYRVRD